MTTLEGRNRTALLVVDVQVDVMDESVGSDAVIARIAQLVSKARAEDVPVIWVQHSDAAMAIGAPGWQIAPPLVPAEGETVVRKLYNDSFEATTLELELAALGVGTLVVAGAQTDACVRATLHGGVTRGYDVTLVSDAHTTADLSAWGAPTPDLVIEHTNMYWSYHKAPGRIARVVAASEVDFTSETAGASR